MDVEHPTGLEPVAITWFCHPAFAQNATKGLYISCIIIGFGVEH